MKTTEEITTRILEISNEQERLATEMEELAAQLQKPIQKADRQVLLTFGKDVITWKKEQALVIKGKGYKLLKALYEAKKMRLKESTLDQLIWKGNVKHHTFKEFIRRLAEKLEKAKFPYRLLPVKSKPKVKQTRKKYKGNKPEMVFIPPEIIGVKLHGTKLCANVAGK